MNEISSSRKLFFLPAAVIVLERYVFFLHENLEVWKK